jgi:hypothetical protein
MPLIANRQLTVIFPEDAGKIDVTVKAGDDIYSSINAAEWVLRTFDSRTPYGPGCDDHCILALPPQRSARAPSARTSGGGARHTMLAAPSFTGIFKALEDNLTTEAAMLEPLDNSLQTIALRLTGAGGSGDYGYQPQVPPCARAPARPPARPRSTLHSAQMIVFINRDLRCLRFVDNGRGLTNDELRAWGVVGKSNHRAESEGAADGGWFSGYFSRFGFGSKAACKKLADAETGVVGMISHDGERSLKLSFPIHKVARPPPPRPPARPPALPAGLEPVASASADEGARGAGRAARAVEAPAGHELPARRAADGRDGAAGLGRQAHVRRGAERERGHAR